MVGRRDRNTAEQLWSAVVRLENSRRFKPDDEGNPRASSMHSGSPGDGPSSAAEWRMFGGESAHASRRYVDPTWGSSLDLNCSDG